jgi:hypothetical protein
MTIREFACKHAAVMRQSVSVVAKSESGKVAKAASDDRVELKAAIKQMLDELEGNRDDLADTALQLLDEELGVPSQTFKKIKKGSVENLLLYEQQIDLLLTKIRFT